MVSDDDLDLDEHSENGMTAEFGFGDSEMAE